MMADLILLPVLLYAGVTLFARFHSQKMLFLPGPSSYTQTEDILFLKTRDGLRIAAKHLQTPDAQFTILFSHGNAEDIGDDTPFLRELQQLGFNVFAYDYRGYGLSDGTPTEKGTYRDIRAAYDYLTVERDIPPEHIILYGRSVGGGPSMHLAAHVPVAGVILQGTFVSAYRVMTGIPLIPFDRYPNKARLDDLSCPVLVMHGTADRVIPFTHGRVLYETAKAPKDNLWLDGVGHNDFPGPYTDEFHTKLTQFRDSLRP